MNQEIKVKFGNNLSQVYQDALSIRRAVFIEEQNIAPNLEYDDQDPIARHFVAYWQEAPVCTMRLITGGHQGHLGRVATLKAYRHRGIARDLLKEIEVREKAAGITKISLNAQLSAIPFYEKAGYVSFGEIFLDAGIKHRAMTKALV